MKMITEITLGKEKEFELELPLGSVIRRWEMGVEEQKVAVGIISSAMIPGQRILREIPTLFIEMDPKASLVKRKFKVVQTNEPVDNCLEYVTSLIAPSSMTWFHLFEERPSLEAILD
jgi:hypothetical protein